MEREQPIPQPVEILVTYYEAARAETLVRIQQRDLTIFTFVAVLGAYFGFVVAEQLSLAPAASRLITETVTVLALPVMCACFMLIYQQHHLIIAMLTRYTNVELFPDGKTPHLTASKSMRRVVGAVHDLGFFGQSGLIASPLLYGFIYWARNHDLTLGRFGPDWLGNVAIADAVGAILAVSFVLLVVVAAYAYLRRITLRDTA